MKIVPLFTAVALAAGIAAATTHARAATTTTASPKPKISVAPKTIRAAKYKQDTAIKRSQRHPEATNGTSASGENPQQPVVLGTPTPHP